MEGFRSFAIEGFSNLILNIRRAVAHWLQDSVIRRLFKNAGYLLSGNIAASALGMVTAAFTARALGPEFFGVLVLMQTYARLVDQILHFQSWQALIKYATEALEQKRDKDFEALIALGTLVDVGTALPSTIVAMLAFRWAGPWIGLDNQYVELAMLYALIILFNPIGAPIAILRLFDRFELMATVNVIGSLVKLLVTAAAFVIKAEFSTFVFIYMGTDILQQLLLVAMGWHTLRQHEYHWAFKWPDGDIWQNLVTTLKMSRSFEGLWSFMISSNLSSIAKLIVKQGDIILLGSLMGARAVGIYKVVMLLVNVVRQVSDPLFQAIYPEIARLIARRRFDIYRILVSKIVVSLSLYSATVWFGFAVFGKALIGLGFGYEYLDAWKPLLIYMGGIAAALFTIHTVPTLWAVGKAQTVLVINAASGLLYILILYVCVSRYGMVGAALAFLIYSVGQALVRTSVTNYELNRHKRLQAQG